MKEKALKRSEEDDIRELKGMIIEKFSEAEIKGFENREQLLKALGKSNKLPVLDANDGDMALENKSVTYALDDRTFLAYTKN